ncbi:sortase [Christensenellaceae bacterium OttesenSCG-928-L17]|nr:sortase [Christensenellaceae bacterium OttesenSCG-928-L17]
MPNSKRKRGSPFAFITIVAFLLLVGGSLLYLNRDAISSYRRVRVTEGFLDEIAAGAQVVRVEKEAPEMDGEKIDMEAMTRYAQQMEIVQTEEELKEAARLEAEGAMAVKGILTIEKIDLKLPVFVGTGTRQLKYGIGWLQVSSDPGKEGNCMLFGHRTRTLGELFSRLDELEQGDLVQVEDMAGNAYTYVVTERTVLIPAKAASQLFTGYEPGGTYLSMVTGTPQGVGSHRLIIWCELYTGPQ